MADEQGGLGEFDELSKSRAALLAQQNRLVEMLAERNKPSDFEFYSNLARGFSDPNAKSFAQGLGSAVGNLQEGSERQRGKDLQMYQIRSQLAQSQYDLDKQNAMARQVQQAMFGSPSMGSNDALKMAAQAGLPAGPTVEAASLIGAPTQQKRMFDSLDDQTKRMIAVQARIDPAKAIDSLAKMGIEIGTKNATKTDAQKAFEYQLGLLPQELHLLLHLHQLLLDPKHPLQDHQYLLLYLISTLKNLPPQLLQRLFKLPAKELGFRLQRERKTS
jgi:hypothetical protein